MSYQINYLASAVKNLQINKIPALETAINRISKKINVSGVDDLIQNINQLREEYGILSKDDNLSSFKETYTELLNKYNLVDNSVKILDATLASVLTDVNAMKRAYKAITVMRDFTEIENTMNSFKENYENIFMLNGNFKRLDDIEETFKELNYKQLAETREYNEANDYELIKKNLKQIVDEVYKFTQTGDVMIDKEYDFYYFNNDSTMKATPMNYLKYIRDTCKDLVTDQEYMTEIEGVVDRRLPLHQIQFLTNEHLSVKETLSELGAAVDSKVNQEEYNEKISDLESSVGSKVDQSDYERLVTEVNTKINRTTFDDVTGDLQSQISNKVEQGGYEETISNINSDIASKVDQSTFEGIVSTIESNINSKVSQTEYNQKISSLETNIDNKVNQTDYDQKITSIESSISGVEGQVTILGNKDCLTNQIDYNPYLLVSNEALTANGLSESDRRVVNTNLAKNIIKESAEITSKVENEIDLVIKPKLTDHESRISALETSEPTDVEACLAKTIAVAPYKYITNKTLANMGINPTTIDKKETTDMVAETAIIDAYELANGYANEVKFYVKAEVSDVKQRVQTIEDADFEGRISALETNGGSSNCLDNEITVQPLILFTDEAFVGFQNTKPDANKTDKLNIKVETAIIECYQQAAAITGELQFVEKPAIANVKERIQAIEDAGFETRVSSLETYSNNITVQPFQHFSSQAFEELQKVQPDADRSTENSINVGYAIKEAYDIAGANMAEFNYVTRPAINNLTARVDKLTPSDYHTYHMYERLFTKTTDFPAIESAIMFKSGYDVGVTKLKLDVYYGIENKLQITTDMIPDHLKNITTLSVYLILSLNFPETIGNYGFTISNETDLTLKLEKVFIDANNNTNGEANIGDITISNFVVYSNDSVITVSMYNKPLRYTLMFDHERGSNVTGIDLINIQHNINDEIPTRTIKFIDNVSQEEFTPTITKVVL